MFNALYLRQQGSKTLATLKPLQDDELPAGRLRLRKTRAKIGRIFNAQRWIVAWSTKMPRSCIIASMWRRLSGYAAYQRAHTSMTSNG